MWWCITVVVSFITVQVSFGDNDFYGWDYINLHCRDNHNAPVDWWYIYKPPSEDVPYLDLGHKFSYIASNTRSRWQASDRQITSNSMLQHTLQPLYRKSYRSRLAYVVYEKRDGGSSDGTTAYGLLIADQRGGLWIGHTVPGFPDLTKRYPSLPEAEAPKGHLLYCISLDLITVNQLAISIKKAEPRLVALRIPVAMKQYVKAWRYFTEGEPFLRRSNDEWLKRDNFDFISRQQTSRAAIKIRRPGQTNCMYKDFARQRNIVLDVYGHGNNGMHKNTICTGTFSLRSIDGISLKLPETRVYYIPQKADRSRFAVSTAAHWQRRGGQNQQYWTCISRKKTGDYVCMEKALPRFPLKASTKKGIFKIPPENIAGATAGSMRTWVRVLACLVFAMSSSFTV